MDVEWATASCQWGGGPRSPPQHRQESRLLLSVGMVKALPTPGPSHLPAAPVAGTTGQYGVSLWVGLGLQLHLRPFAPLNSPDLPCLDPPQRLSTSLHLCSAMDTPPPLLVHSPLAPRLFIISLPLPVIPTSPWKMPALAGTAVLALTRHRLRHHSEGKKTPGNRGQMAALPDKEWTQCLYSRRLATCFTRCPKLWYKILSSNSDTASKADISSMS